MFITLVGILVFLVGLVLAICVVIDVAPRPEAAFKQAGTSRVLWIVLAIVGALLCPLLAVIVGYLWFLNYRQKVIAAQGEGLI